MHGRIFVPGIGDLISGPHFSEPPPEGGLDLVTNRQGAI